MDFLAVLEHHIPDHRLFTLFTLGGMTFYLTKHMVLMWIVAGAMAVGFPLMARSWPLVATGPRNALEVFVVFMRDDIVIPCMGPEGRPFVPYFLTLFFFILFNNLLGFIPGVPTTTANIGITAALAICSFVFINVAGVRKHGWRYITNFIPDGVPKWVVPLIFPLELLGVLTRSFALCIRLFGNMLGGHIVVLAFLALSFILKFLLVSVITVPMAVLLSCLELFICFLQAYIFTFLTALFVGSSIHPH
jgi:F-type H+-transporting ATPase subunit a